MFLAQIANQNDICNIPKSPLKIKRQRTEKVKKPILGNLKKHKPIAHTVIKDA